MKSWSTDAVFYHNYPLGFCGAPKQNDGGEIENRILKLIDWIPHLKKLGITAVYLGPVFESSEHGYDTKDYYKIDRRLGDQQSFQEVCRQLHANGIRIVLDGVFNHVGREFWAFEDVRRNGPDSQYCSWFHNLNFGGGSPMGDPFWYDAWEGHYNLVKLNLQNPQVRDHLLGAVESWIRDFDIDGLRLDAADCVDPAFFRQLRRFCRERKPDFWLVGEIIHGDYTRWANPEMLDSVTNYECYKGIYSSHNDKNYFEIAYSLNRQFGENGLYRDLSLYNFVDNHDVNRVASMLKNPAHLKNVYTLLFTMPGVPSVYYGSEFGIQGIKQNNADDKLRPCLELERLAAEGDGGLNRHIGRLSEIRGQFAPLRVGGYRQTVVKNEQLVYCRATAEQEVYTALNLAETESEVRFPLADGQVLVDVLGGGQAFTPQNGFVSVAIPACSARILAAEKETERSLPQFDQGQTAERSDQPAVLPGRYRHFKGHEYQVLGVARHSETLEPLVIYQDPEAPEKLWGRPVAMFLETVTVDGQQKKRFEKIE